MYDVFQADFTQINTTQSNFLNEKLKKNYRKVGLIEIFSMLQSLLLEHSPIRLDHIMCQFPRQRFVSFPFYTGIIE